MDFDSDPLIKTTDKTDSLEMVRYMVKMRQSLKLFYPNLFHVT